MKITFRLQDETLTATLDDTAIARDFASMLPLTLQLEDYAQSEKIGYLPRKLNTQGSPAGAGGKARAITYYAPWGNLALFYEDFAYAEGLIVLGKFEGAVDTLRAQDPGKVTIEQISR